jgi:DNA / pantothenate metabolism flavoprotein
MKRILVTAGPVYGRLDDNKLVSNRARGLWATDYARWLVQQGRDYQVTLLVPDLLFAATWQRCRLLDETSALTILTHEGFTDYQQRCQALAPHLDAAVLAAAVVNWIPAAPITGKMPTAGYQPGDQIMVPFVLAPRVIDTMKAANPKLTLIGCKMTAGAPYANLITAAYETLLHAHANAIVANDLTELPAKTVVHPDHTEIEFNVKREPYRFYRYLTDLIEDEHYTTILSDGNWRRFDTATRATTRFTRTVNHHRDAFQPRHPGHDRVFGAVATRLDTGWLCSPREKGAAFTVDDAVYVPHLDHHARQINAWHHKATLNAPLLIRHLDYYPAAAGVIHLHRQLPDVPTEPYAPPGTVRDSQRTIPGPIYNIAGHGCIACVDENGALWNRS